MAVKRKKREKKVREVAEVKEFQVEYVDADSIFLWGDNPRINDDASEKLAKVIEAHGVKSPIVCWDKNRTIYKGNTTYKALKILGYKKVPVVFHSFPSESAAKAYGIADNKASEEAMWDDDLLLGIMGAQEFQKEGLVETTGFSKKEIELLEFFPPSEERKEKAEREGKRLVFKIVAVVPAEDYQNAKSAIEKAIEPFEGAEVK